MYIETNVVDSEIWKTLPYYSEPIVANPIPSNKEVLAGVRRAVQKVVERAKRDDDELVIADKDGKPIRVKARDL